MRMEAGNATRASGAQAGRRQTNKSSITMAIQALEESTSYLSM